MLQFCTFLCTVVQLTDIFKKMGSGRYSVLVHHPWRTNAIFFLLVLVLLSVRFYSCCCEPNHTMPSDISNCSYKTVCPAYSIISHQSKCTTIKSDTNVRIKRNRQLRSCVRLAVFLLFLSGDIELNPGPCQTFTTYYQNVQSIKNKLLDCTINMNELLNYDCLVLSETWLNNYVSDCELPFDSYFSIYRNDRQTRGGGVMVCVKRNWSSQLRSDLMRDCEIIWVEVCTNLKRKLLIGCYYRPHKRSPMILLEECRDSVLAAAAVGDVVLFGDFNLSIKWASSTNGVPKDSTDSWFLDTFIHGLGLYQHNMFNTRKDSNLDYVVSTLANVVITPSQNILSSDHESLDVEFPINRTHSANKCSPCDKKFPVWKNAPWSEIQRVLNLFPWSLLYHGSINDATELLISVVHSIISDFVPHKVMKSSKFPAWFDHELLCILRNKKRAWQLWKSYPNEHTYNTFVTLRRHSKFLLRKKYLEYIGNITSKVNSDPKCFWSIINQRNKSSRIPQKVQYDTQYAEKDHRAGLFSKFFQNNFTLPNASTDLPELSPVIPHSLSSLSTSPAEVETLLTSLPLNRAVGPDNIKTVFLRNTASPLSIPLSILLNRCFSEGVFPDLWKMANITPVFKSGNKNYVSSYRPISLLSPFSIIAEKIIKNRLYRFTSPYLSTSQHGFLPGSSCLTNLSVLLSHAIKSLASNSQLDVVYIDLSKAFDSISHRHLLHKLSNRYNVHGNFLSLLNSYLNNRQQRVVISGSSSEFFPVLSGVPQGSVLGPLLFVLYIDDLAEYFCRTSRNILLFADDCKLFRNVSHEQDVELLQNDIFTFVSWCDKWLLKVNPQKSTTVTISLKKFPIKSAYFINDDAVSSVSSHKDLGVVIDSKLNFNDHITATSKSAMRLLGMLYRFTEIRDPSALSLFYKSFISPKIEFSSPIWSMATSTNLKRIDSVLHFFLAIVRHRVPSLRSLSKSSLLNFLKIQTPSRRRSFSDLKFLYKIVNGSIRNEQLLSELSLRVPTRSTRSSHLFYTDTPRLSLIQRSLFFRLSTLYNSHSPQFDIFGPQSSFLAAMGAHI